MEIEMANVNPDIELLSTNIQEGSRQQLEEITSQIRTFVLNHFPLTRQRSIQNGDPLLDSGIVDSLGILELVDFLEHTFGMTISDEDLIPENFHSIQSIALFVKHKKMLTE
jgi:acyl carrier protein